MLPVAVLVHDCVFEGSRCHAFQDVISGRADLVRLLQPLGSMPSGVSGRERDRCQDGLPSRRCPQEL